MGKVNPRRLFLLFTAVWWLILSGLIAYTASDEYEKFSRSYDEQFYREEFFRQTGQKYDDWVSERIRTLPSTNPFERELIKRGLFDRKTILEGAALKPALHPPENEVLNYFKKRALFLVDRMQHYGLAAMLVPFIGWLIWAAVPAAGRRLWRWLETGDP